MRINTNISALVSYHSLARSTGQLEKSISRLSTGLKIETASDDAAGLAISEKIRAQSKGVDRAYQNVQDGISLLQTADGALDEVHSILQRMRELSVQSANDSLTSDDREYIQLEIDQLTSQINDIATQTQFNKKKLLNGDASVLWSSSSSDIGVIVTGSIRGKDQFGTVLNNEGNYKITFSETYTGTENIQKSNILTLKHGTLHSNVQYNVSSNSGLQKLEAMNMVEGSWRLETREVPFGGVTYYVGNTIADPTGIGGEVKSSNAPSIVAPGEYDIRLSNKVPMMAEFNDAYTNFTVDGIDVSNLGTSRDFDARFSTEINQTGSGATRTDMYDDAAGGAGNAATVGINTNTNANIFTRYEVLDTDKRDTLRAPVQLIESYVTGDNAQIDMTLTYRSKAADTATATYTYTTAGTNSVTLESTWRTTTAQQITANLAYTVMEPDDPLDPTGPKHAVPHNDTVTIDIAAGSTIEDISLAMDAALNARGIYVDHNEGTRSSNAQIHLRNASTAAGDRSAYTISFTDAFSAAIGLTGSVASGGDGYYSTGKNYNNQITRNVSGSIENVRTSLNTAFSQVGGGSVTVTTTAGQSHLVFNGATADAYGGNEISVTGSSGSAWTELGGGFTSIAAGAAPQNGTDVYNGFTRTVALGGQNIGGVAGAINTGVNVGATGFTATATAGDIAHITLSNNSIYNITLSGGTTMSELHNGSITVNRGAADVNMNGNVYNGYTTSTNVIKNGRMNDIQAQLNSTLNYALTHNQSLTGGRQNLFGLTGGDNSNRSVTLSNDASTTTTGTPPVTTVHEVYYDIQLTNHATATSNVLNEINFNVNAQRNSATVSSTAMAWQLKTDTFGTAGMEMAQVFDAINAHQYLSTTWAENPNTDGNHWGRFNIKNDHTDASGAARRSYGTESTGGAQDAKNQTRGIGNLDLTYGFTRSTETWQTRDAFRVQATAQGNYNSGAAIDITRTIGAANAATYGDRGNSSRDWLWEGGTAESTRNAGKMNAQFGNAIEGGLYTAFQVGDTSKESQIDEGDSWILFTQARTTPGNATFLNVKVGDSRTGDQKEVTYAFNKGALSGDRVGTLNQMLYVNKTTIQLLQHHIDFGNQADNTIASFSYGERGGAGNVEDWKNGNSTNAYAWDSHTYYGDESTYYFQNTTNADNVLLNIKTHKQNDINASLMFTYDNGELKVKGRGVDANGNTPAGLDGQAEMTITKAQADAAARGAELEIFGVRFTDLKIDWGRLSSQDKFVVNVAAAAKTETLNTTGAAGNFMSYENVSITGDPFQQGNDRTGSSAQYRLKDNTGVAKFSGTTPMNMLGFFVSPVNGSNATRGVGYYDGTLQMTFDNDFNTLANMTVGKTNNDNVQDATAHRIHAEVNYQGKTQYSAGALVTSGYFMSMEMDRSHVLADYVKGIGYSDYEYTMVGTTWQVANGNAAVADKYKYTKVNGSMIFDVTNIEDEVITFRVQGHFIDRDGKEYYGQEEEFKVHTGANTERNTSLENPIGTGEEDVKHPVRLFSDIMFADQEYGGIFLDEFTLGEAAIWTIGDRFAVTLTASGFEDGTSIDDQNKDLNSPIDEINLFSDNRGSTMPHTFRFNEGVLDNSRTDLHIYQLSNNLIKDDSNDFYKDQVMDGTLSLTFGEYNPPLDPTLPVDPADPTGGHQRIVHDAATFEIVYGQGEDFGVAHYYSNVRDIAQFYDKNGRYILEGGNESLTIKQGDKQTSIAIQESWEVGEMAHAMSDAIWSGVLGQHDHELRGEGEIFPDSTGEKQYMVDDKDRYRIFDFVNTVPGVNEKESVVGTMIAHSVVSGENAALEFYGSDALEKAFGFNTIQNGTDSQFRANVTDAHTGNMVTSNVNVVAGTTNYDMLFDGVALTIDSDLGILRSTYDKTSGTFKLDVNDQFSTIIHLADNTTTLQIGANEGENLMLSLGDMSAKALGIANLSVRSREAAARAITKIDLAISAVSKQRAVIGAQINRLEHTMESLANTSTNLNDARSRIVNADMAKEMMNNTRINIITQAGSSMLVQANQIGNNVLSLLR